MRNQLKAQRLGESLGLKLNIHSQSQRNGNRCRALHKVFISMLLNVSAKPEDEVTVVSVERCVPAVSWKETIG